MVLTHAERENIAQVAQDLYAKSFNNGEPANGIARLAAGGVIEMVVKYMPDATDDGRDYSSDTLVESDKKEERTTNAPDKSRTIKRKQTKKA